ncbi:alpha/beta hydrolase [Saccharopolyspora sp. ID03-671]|uniref:alpha/beta hydrolase n=1 Tax=Saccharopolyspora sp. ID03-671 TaxID=3073066 RepID=UPI00324675F1
MPVDPALTPFLPFPSMPAELDIAAFRAQDEETGPALMEQVAEAGPAVAEHRIIEIPVTDGSIELAVYRPDASGPLPVHLYFHGGGWVAGSALSPATDVIARERAVGATCVTVAVNYRKAPEHPFPVALHDCQAALKWALDHAAELSIDPHVITLGGGSAGGNLAAALALKLRDENGPAIALQLLEVPALDLTMKLPSHSDPELRTRYALSGADAERMVPMYLGEDGDPRDPYASPLHAADVSGLAPAYIMSAEFDLLCDDGAAYAEKLQNAGVPARFSLQAGHVHGSSAFTKVMPSARAWREEALHVLRQANTRALAWSNPTD